MTKDDRTFTSLQRKIEQLSPQQVDVVERFADAVLTPVDSESMPATWLTTPTWDAAFTAWLQGYHALSTEPLGRLQFEAAFNQACDIAGWEVEPAGSATQRFFDTKISDDAGTVKYLSLKASSAKDMNPSRIHISKLTEAAWIQDARRQADRRKNIIELFRDYQDTTSAILMLRGFRNQDGYSVSYELIEVPTSIFSTIFDLTVLQSQASTINIPPGVTPRDRHFGIRLDRSDAKITLTGIRIDKCIVHGRWRLS